MTLQNILPTQETTDRVRQADNVGGVGAGNAGLLKLARRYGVTVVATKNVAGSGAADQRYTLHSLPH